jgi:hypothetical protein
LICESLDGVESQLLIDLIGESLRAGADRFFDRILGNQKPGKPCGTWQVQAKVRKPVPHERRKIAGSICLKQDCQ